MAALHMALATALADRRKSIVAADALYGATVRLLMNVLEPPASPCASPMSATWTRCAPRSPKPGPAAS